MEDIMEKIKEMLPDVMDFLSQESKRLLSCGGIETYDEGYLTAKIVLAVALKNCSFRYKPLLKHQIKEMKNLERF